ncbi:MAG TPA: lamin tail domain-containing protein [bacterium]|nr:lamin tail domain-containing protein [bacterium]HNT65897.1 lamin tail domain-containing protein [bacterium]HOX86623.1 lamin tail domain-containing protein [bacterium]HPG46187.1 lamin tail domain-containing protein [bacterium]HPM98185.1 lamin tail domain-containing protein [bacterium]
MKNRIVLLVVATLVALCLMSCSREAPAIMEPIVLGEVMMNEAYSRGVPDTPDWVELYNSSSVAVSLTGYKIYDPGGNAGSKPKKEFPADASIPGKGYYVIVVDTPDESGFGLSSGGDEIWLEDNTGTVIDYVTITAMSETQSYSRIPNGSETWQLSNTITRGAENQP